MSDSADSPPATSAGAGPYVPRGSGGRRLFRAGSIRATPDLVDHYWARTPESLLEQLGTAQQGLSTAEAAARLRKFGNMVSMAAASLFLPFLPLTAGQILLNNFMSDIPALGIADDSVDPELIDRPRRWDTGFIGRYMIEFGLLSSIFDFLTFGLLLWVFHAAPAEFQTTWFVESLLTELVIAIVVRTRRPFFASRPGTMLLGLTLVIAAITALLPYLPFMSVFGFVPVPWTLTAMVIGIAALYVAAVEVAKPGFYRRLDLRLPKLSPVH